MRAYLNSEQLKKFEDMAAGCTKLRLLWLRYDDSEDWYARGYRSLIEVREKDGKWGIWGNHSSDYVFSSAAAALLATEYLHFRDDLREEIAKTLPPPAAPNVVIHETHIRKPTPRHGVRDLNQTLKVLDGILTPDLAKELRKNIKASTKERIENAAERYI